ncbi:olfactory receptor 2AP1-like [Hyla sarda]|uniref:olfactory receptor 2AP1-like n=1 Tax=Hyla sarda TaxID=327740 RepID=UPI0024C366FB|nr:olfactory receptor 2AP1-like [Hyla sarda]
MLSLIDYIPDQSPTFAPRLNSFLDSTSLPSLTDPERNLLNSPISYEDVSDTIASLKLGKAPGPDGLSAMYYKKFSPILVPHLVNLYNNLFKTPSLPPEYLDALITVIPKPQKDPSLVSNYRPISLINLDTKILTSILARRLNTILPRVIHADQVGFIPGRQAADNIRKTLVTELDSPARPASGFPVSLQLAAQRRVRGPGFFSPSERLEDIFKKNLTVISEFLLLGFENLHNFKTLLFFLFFTIYIFTVLGNLLIVILVSTSPQIQSPMYFFLSHLSVSDILLTTYAIPNMLRVVLEEGGTMSVHSCLIQFYFICVSTIVECFLLMVMSYDRYQAICNPLHYNSIMNYRFCTILVFLSWFLGSTWPLIAVIPVFYLVFCQSNVIDHFYCDFAPIMELSCSDTSLVEKEVFLSSFPTVVFPFLFIIVTYFYISRTVMGIPTIAGRKKAFSTCSSHLAVVSAYYGTLIIKYIVPFRGNSHVLNKSVSLLYTVFTPFFNPIIYSLRNKDIKKAMKKMFWYCY